MRDQKNDILELCESWWSQVSTTTREDQQRYAAHFLALLGWREPVRLKTKQDAVRLSPVSFLLRGGGQTTVAAHFLMPGALDPPGAIVEKGLDYCPVARMLVNASHGLKAHYALISDLYRSYLYDVRTDELVSHADTPKVFHAELAPHLNRVAVERGAMEEMRRQPRSHVAKQLRNWAERWVETFEGRIGLSEENVNLLFDRLVVMRYLFERESLSRTRPRLRRLYQELAAAALSKDQPPLGDPFASLCDAIHGTWRIDLFESAPNLMPAFKDESLISAMLREFFLLSRAKFSIATILESFNFGDPAEKMRVRMVPEVNDEREAYLAKQSVNTIDEAKVEIDLAEEGYRALFFWYDRMAALYERLAADFEAAETMPEPEPDGALDLLDWSAQNARRPSACTDHLAYALDNGLCVYYQNPRQRRTARLMLTLHVISRYDQTRQSMQRMPAIGKVMQKRPLVLAADRVMDFGT